MIFSIIGIQKQTARYNKQANTLKVFSLEMAIIKNIIHTQQMTFAVDIIVQRLIHLNPFNDERDRVYVPDYVPPPDQEGGPDGGR